MLSKDNNSIYTLYENKILLKEFSPTTVNTLIKDGNHNNLYIMKSYKKNEDGTYNGEIDTIYEIYVSLHSDQRSGERDIKNILSKIDTCLECIPVEFLVIPNGQVRHVVFDIFNKSNQIEHMNKNVTELPCSISAKTPTTLTQKIKEQIKNVKVEVCDVVIKTVVNLQMPEYSRTDLNNNAIHLPVSIDGGNHDLHGVGIVCDLPEVVKPVYNHIKKACANNPDVIISNLVSHAGNLNNRKQIRFDYKTFFKTLHEVKIVNYPFYPVIKSTFPKTQDVKLINDVDPNNPGSGFDNWMSAFQQGYNVNNSPVNFTVGKGNWKDSFKYYDNENKTKRFNLPKPNSKPLPMTDNDVERYLSPATYAAALAADKLRNNGRWSKDRDERLKRVEELKKLQ